MKKTPEAPETCHECGKELYGIDVCEDGDKYVCRKRLEAKPDYDTPCIVCGDTPPTLPLTGMCGPCTFGEAETAEGNW